MDKKDNNKQSHYPTFYSDEAQEILSAKPVWVLRYGTIIMFFITLGIVIGSYLIRYPDTETIPVIVSTNQSNTDIIMKVPSNKINLTQTGQEVIITLIGFDSSQLTSLKGRIKKISDIYENTPIGLFYPVELELDNEEKQKDNMENIQNLNAQATIITSEKRIIERILSSMSRR